LNFKIFLLTLCFLCSCGLKTDPVAPEKKNLPSLIEQHKFKNPSVKKKEKKKNKDKQEQ
tara:strand:+ start:14075 stop:14251 length:177 start_codon:yes stop_codon:yes gene_type:complete